MSEPVLSWKRQDAQDAVETLETFDKHGLPAFVRGVDAEALYFFLALFRTGTLPRAAEQLGISLSSANRMLAKLRTYWDDPLFVRSGFLMQPTTAAKRRYDKVLSFMHVLEDLRRDDELDPRTLSRTVRTACYDNAFALCIASIFADFTARMPHVRLRAMQADEHLFDYLREDLLDLVFFARQGLHPDVHSVALLTTPYVCLVRRGHPLSERAAALGPLEREDLEAFPQVLINAQPDRYRAPNSPGNGWFNPKNPDRIALVTPFFLAASLCLEETDCYAIVPKATAELALDSDASAFRCRAKTHRSIGLTRAYARRSGIAADPRAALGADSKALWAAGRRVAMLHSLWILAATLFTVLTYVFVKWVPPQYEIWDIFFVRSCYMAFFAVLMAAAAKTPLKTKIPKAHIGRAICGMLALLINIVTVQHLQIGTAETLFYTMPLFVSLFVIIEKMRLGERTDWVLVGSVLCGFAGICMVLQPSCGSHELPYAVLAVLSAILAAGSAMFLKRLGAAGEPIFRTVFWFSAASLVISAVAEAFLSSAAMKDLFTDPMLFAVGICTMGAQLAQTLGWGRGRPLLCACLQFSAILFAVFFGWLFFDEKLESFATVGIVIIIAAELAAAVIGLRSRARRGSSA